MKHSPDQRRKRTFQTDHRNQAPTYLTPTQRRIKSGLATWCQPLQPEMKQSVRFQWTQGYNISHDTQFSPWSGAQNHAHSLADQPRKFDIHQHLSRTVIWTGNSGDWAGIQNSEVRSRNKTPSFTKPHSIRKPLGPCWNPLVPHYFISHREAEDFDMEVNRAHPMTSSWDINNSGLSQPGNWIDDMVIDSKPGRYTALHLSLELFKKLIYVSNGYFGALWSISSSEFSSALGVF